jgi:hypothetical protein
MEQCEWNSVNGNSTGLPLSSKQGQGSNGDSSHIAAIPGRLVPVAIGGVA